MYAYHHSVRATQGMDGPGRPRQRRTAMTKPWVGFCRRSPTAPRRVAQIGRPTAVSLACAGGAGELLHGTAGGDPQRLLAWGFAVRARANPQPPGPIRLPWRSVLVARAQAETRGATFFIPRLHKRKLKTSYSILLCQFTTATC